MSEEASVWWCLITAGIAIGFAFITGPLTFVAGAGWWVGCGISILTVSFISLLSAWKYFVWNRKK